MITWILLSTIFLAVFLILRAIFVNKINIRVMFFLWILVAVRLLVPTYIPIYSTDVPTYGITSLTSHILNLDETIPYVIETYDLFGETDTTETTSATEYTNSLLPEENENKYLAYIVEHPWQFIWFLGVVVVALFMILSNVRWYQHLRRYRTPLETMTGKFDSPLPVYYVKSLKSPCLVGFFKPCVYVNDQIFDDDKGFYIIRHELTHYKQKDFVWMLIQMICVCIHWFNPLVWYAAFLFRRDNECVCDAIATKDFSPEDRIAYGKLLLNTTAARYNLSDVLTTATSMSMEGKTLKKRIQIILHKGKKRMVGSIIAAFLLIVLFFNAIIGSADVEDGIWSGTYSVKNFEQTEPTTFTFYDNGTMKESRFGNYRFETNENGEETIILSTLQGQDIFDVRSLENFNIDDRTIAEIRTQTENDIPCVYTYGRQHPDISNTISTSYGFNPGGIYEVSSIGTYEVRGNTLKIGVDEWIFQKGFTDDVITLRYKKYPDVKMYLEPVSEDSTDRNES